MQIRENILLAPYTTFKIGGPAKFFCVAENAQDVGKALRFAQENKLPIFVLGGGSNVLVSDQGFKGLVMQINVLGLDILQENQNHVILKIGAGENWDKVVNYAVGRGLWGIENLSHIPGNAGALVVQNVGAYGQEASEVVESVEVLDMQSLRLQIFKTSHLNFTYRHSILNTTQKNKYIVLSVTLKLSKIPKPVLSYGDVKKYFADRNMENPGLQQIRQAIVGIRDGKFPFPKEAVNGNVGSFFRGGIISPEKMLALKNTVAKKYGPEEVKKIDEMADRLKVAQGFKTPTAFLIELCGLKGHQIGGAKINPPQPAIVINANGKATAKDVLALADEVKQKVRQVFGVKLEIEPEFVGF